MASEIFKRLNFKNDIFHILGDVFPQYFPKPSIQNIARHPISFSFLPSLQLQNKQSLFVFAKPLQFFLQLLLNIIFIVLNKPVYITNLQCCFVLSN